MKYPKMSAVNNGGHSTNGNYHTTIIGALGSHNTYDTSSRKECKKDGAREPFHDEGDDAIESQQKYMCSFKSTIGQEEGQKTIVDNVLFAAPSQVTIVTKHTNNTTDTPSKNNLDKE